MSHPPSRDRFHFNASSLVFLSRKCCVYDSVLINHLIGPISSLTIRNVDIATDRCHQHLCCKSAGILPGFCLCETYP